MEIIALAVVLALSMQSIDYEEEPVLSATSLIQPALLSGPGFSVDTHVEIRGYMAHFILDTKLGPLEAESVEMLIERETEVPAMEALDQVTHSEAFTKAIGSQLGKTTTALGNVFLHPLNTLLGLPSGVARYFGNKLEKAGDRAQTLADRATQQLGNVGTNYPPTSGPMIDARSSETTKPEERWYSRLSKEAARETKRQLKFNQLKRELAEQLKIDPYTSNPYIQEQLNSLAWAGVAGYFTTDVAFGAVGGASGAVLGRGTQINNLVWKLDPDDLREHNYRRLQAFCRDEFLIRQFLRRGNFTPTLQTRLVDALEQLKPASGCEQLLELGMMTNSELEARFMINVLQVLVAELRYHNTGGKLHTIGAGLAYQTSDGELILPLPVDYLSWTPQIKIFFQHPLFKTPRKTVLLANQATLPVQRALTQDSWNIKLHVRWPGSPPYANGYDAMLDPATGL